MTAAYIDALRGGACVAHIGRVLPLCMGGDAYVARIGDSVHPHLFSPLHQGSDDPLVDYLPGFASGICP